jgi:hypothetical protein
MEPGGWILWNEVKRYSQGDNARMMKPSGQNQGNARLWSQEDGARMMEHWKKIHGVKIAGRDRGVEDGDRRMEPGRWSQGDGAKEMEPDGWSLGWNQ